MASSTVALLAIATFVAALLLHSSRSIFRQKSARSSYYTSLPLAGPSDLFRRIVTSFRFHFYAPWLVQKAFDQTKGAAFAIPFLLQYTVCVAEPEKIRDLSKADPRTLSFSAFLEEALLPDCTLFRAPDYVGHAATKYVMIGRLKPQLPILCQRIERIVSGKVATWTEKLQNSTSERNWSILPLHDRCRDLSTTISINVAFGETLASRPELQSLLRQFSTDVAVATQLLLFLPSSTTRTSISTWLRRTIISTWMRRSGARDRLYKLVESEVQSRIRIGEKGLEHNQENADCLHWLLEAFTSRDEISVSEIVGRSIGLAFTGVFQPSSLLFYALYRLCIHTEVVDALRNSLQDDKAKSVKSDTVHQDSPELDSFLKEVARMHPLRSLSSDRKVLEDFTFSDGSKVSKGSTICVAQQAIFQDPDQYHNPETFDPWRFLPCSQEGHRHSTDGRTRPCSISRFTDVNDKFPFWGVASRPCPGRWLVAVNLKIIIAHIVRHYDIRLASNHGSHTFSWAQHLLPRPGLQFLIRSRTRANVQE